jgi:dCTP deaminase
MKKGAFPDFMIKDLVRKGYIQTAEENIKPSSIDLTLGEERYRIPGVMTVPVGVTIEDFIAKNEFPLMKHDRIIGVNDVALIRLEDMLDLRSDIYAYANPKSTTGRTDLHVRLFADGTPMSDTVAQAYKGGLWVTVKANSFGVVLPQGSHVNQLRFFNADTRLRGVDLEDFMKEHKPIYLREEEEFLRYSDMRVRPDDHSLMLSLDLYPGEEYVGWVAKEGVNIPIDFSAENESYNGGDFFELIEAKNGFLLLEKGRFYILSSYEHLSIPSGFASEIAALDPRFGDLRNHYAGFIDPGWGVGNMKPITLEVRPFEDMYVHHRQPIARLKIEKMIDIAKVSYDEPGFSNYQIQTGPKLAKYFKV